MTNKRHLTRESVDVAKKEILKRETESLLNAARNTAMGTNHIKAEKDKRNKTADVGYVVIETKLSIT